MNRPLLSAVDAADQLREVAFALLVRDGRPIEVAALATATGLDPTATQHAIAGLADAGWMDLVDNRVSGAAGLSLAAGPHGLAFGGRRYRTWCAYDALGISAALAADAAIETACGQCGAPISLSFSGGVPDRSGPERLWLADGGDDLRRSFCTPTVLLCGDDHGARWAETQGGRGRLLDLAEASRAGGRDWAGCAEAARRVA